MGDVLEPLERLAGVADELRAAREAVDAAQRHRALRRSGGAVAAEVSLHAAAASAALEGAAYDVEDVRGGAVTDPVVQGALRVARAVDGLRDQWPRAPRQVLARLHVLAARGAVPDADLGRPVDDLRVAPRLDALAALVVDGAGPPLLRAAVVHGELLALRPFAGPSGVVARAAARLTLVAGGFDVRGLLPVECGHLDRGPEYLGAANAFATGTPDGLRSWLRHCATATTLAAHRLTALADAVLDRA
ncbi:hypothetical protein GCM10010124_11720 [Pilimelia terevasa]|uniref:Fido domain-containing protein n=1 Tax=Pilimelia terevasa TaxID=53372 RepID=A0A8J3BH35_9ACTN|nr:oxidoreductase [Pilimelia terevasa]GGK20889.1 hypothetical protein GCM10010124_11720 [Pilimelia terevasa]